MTGKVIKKKNQTNNTGNVSSPNESNGKKATASANTVSAVRNGSQIGSTIGSHRRPYGDIEEEKTEIQADTEAPLCTEMISLKILPQLIRINLSRRDRLCATPSKSSHT